MKYVDILNRFGVNHECDSLTGQTYRRPDILVANVALNNVVQHKTAVIDRLSINTYDH